MSNTKEASNMDFNNQKLISFSKDIPVFINIYHYDLPTRHWHPATELLFVLSGSTDIIIEDKSYHLVPEDLCLINRNAIHEIIGNNCHMLSICFKLENLNIIESNEQIYFELNSSGETTSGRYDYIRHLMAQLVKVNASGENKYMTLSILYSLISHLIDNFRSISPVNISSSFKFRDRMASILNYIEGHYQEGLTLKELAQAQDFSVSYLASFFVKNTGMTFLTYYNNLRLNYAVNEMLSSNEPLEKIAYNNGFSDTRSFVSLFKKKYNCLPSEYRKKYGNLKSGSINKQTKNSINSANSTNFQMESNELKKLAKYLTLYDDNNNFRLSTKESHIHIDGGIIDCSIKGIPLSHNFRKLCCVGSARQFLYSDVQSIIRTVQKSIHYQYVKFHGILSDEMMVYMEKEDGTPYYSFTLMDKVLDFLMEVDLKPLMQLSFMPRALASDPTKLIDMWNFNTSPPKDLKKWKDLISAVLHHLIDRYGIYEVRSWLFCVWNEPDGSTDSFGWENPEEFYKFYQETYLTVKSIDDKLMFGTPSLLLHPNAEQSWALNFFQYCIKNNCFGDFLNIHYYDNSFVYSENNVNDYFSISNIGEICPLNVDPFAFTKFINQIKVMNKKLKLNTIPIYLTEWNLTVSQRDLINDTCFKSCYLTKNLLENYDRLDSYGYWCLTDFIEELQLPNELYHGGIGMFTYNGIPKAHYNTFEFLTHLGNEMIAKGNGFFVTKEGNKIIMLLYNYEHYSKLFASGILFDMTNENRYAPFTQMNHAKFQFQLQNLPSNNCMIKELFVNQSQGSSYDAWAKMKLQSIIRKEDYVSLMQVSQPGIYIHHETITNGELFLSVDVEPLEVRMIEINLQ